MNLMRIARATMRIGLGLAVTGAILFQTTGCDLSSTFSTLLSTVGLSTLLNSLVGSGTSA